MCGIAGFCNFNDNYIKNKFKADEKLSILKKMREVISHRGDDQTGQFLRKNVGLSHTRLSIRDISKGIQPMIRTLNNEFAICYNGELYNADELRTDLQNKGYDFFTDCDTEVILFAYIHYKEACLDLLNGIFSFAIFDNEKNQLFLARDRLGVKPLFYTQKNNELIFGSEIKSLFSHPKIEPEINIDTFRQIFGILPAKIPNSGVFSGINELEAGYFAIFNHSGLHLNQYWELESHPHTDDYSHTVSNVSFLVRDSITRQMISDVPVCTFLSGGIDSCIVTAVATEFMQNKGQTLNTYSFDFVGNDKFFVSNSFQPERDLPYINNFLESFSTNHSFLECDEEQLVSLLKKSMIAKDLPSMTDIDASLLHFCKLVKEKNKVTLTGECADEIFGGYPWFYREDLLNGYGFPWSKNIETRSCLLQDNFAKKLDLQSFVANEYENALLKVPRLDGENEIEAKRREITFLNIKWFMQTLLDRMDRMSMQNGLEARVPFADHRIMEYVFNVPWHFKRKNDVEKSLLRDAFCDILPEKILHRKKSPYPKTYNPNFLRLLKENFSLILADKNSPIKEFIDVKKAKDFCHNCENINVPWFGQLMSAPQLIAYFIQINDWLNEYNPKFL